jgi:hypothetical protein
MTIDCCRRRDNCRNEFSPPPAFPRQPDDFRRRRRSDQASHRAGALIVVAPIRDARLVDLILAIFMGKNRRYRDLAGGRDRTSGI